MNHREDHERNVANYVFIGGRLNLMISGKIEERKQSSNGIKGQMGEN